MILIVILLIKLDHRYGYFLCNFAFFDDSSSKEITRKFVFIRKIELPRSYFRFQKNCYILEPSSQPKSIYVVATNLNFNLKYTLTTER